MNPERRKILRINIDFYIIFIITFILSVIGLIMVSSASTVVAERLFNDPYWFLRRQIIWWVISFILLIISSKINYKIYKKLSIFIILISIALLGLVLIPGIGEEIGGSKRWLNLWFFNIQPSEFVKIALVIFFAEILNRKYVNTMKIKDLIFPGFLVLLLTTVLIFMEPDLGTVIVIWLIVFAVLLVAGVKFAHVLGLGIVMAIITGIYLLMEEYRRVRLFAFLNKTAEYADANFQVDQSLIALGSGNLIGLGLGNSLQKYSYLPEAHTDFIFAILGEELGLIGTMLVIVLFLLFAFFGIRVCLRTKDYFGRILAAGLTMIIVVPALINISVVIGLIPVTGLTLPFISSGGSSLMLSMVSVGILLNIARQIIVVSKDRRINEERK